MRLHQHIQSFEDYAVIANVYFVVISEFESERKIILEDVERTLVTLEPFSTLNESVMTEKEGAQDNDEEKLEVEISRSKLIALYPGLDLRSYPTMEALEAELLRRDQSLGFVMNSRFCRDIANKREKAAPGSDGLR